MDLSTLVLVAVLLTFASAAILSVVLRTRKTYPGFGLWTVGMLLVLSGTLVYLISRMIEPWIGIFIGSFLLVAGFVFLYRGLLVFRGHSASYALEVLLTLVFFAGFMFWGFVSPNINMRIAIYSLCIGSVTLASLRLVITDRPPYFGSSDYVLAFWLGIITVFTWSRAVYAVVFLDPINDALGGGNFQSVYVAFQIISVLIITLSLINLNSQRLEYELRGVQRSLEEDIEERRRIEGALLRSQQQYRSLTENMDDNAWIFDMDEQRFVYISSSVRDLSGYSAEEAMSMGMARMVLPADRDRMQAVLAERYEDFLSENITSKNFFVDELEQPCKGGATVWTEISSHFVRSAETGHVELHGVTRDLTRRREIDEALRSSEEKFRLAFDSANTGMFLSDLDGRIQQTNPKAGQILGYKAEELTRARDQDLALAGDAWLTETNRKRMTDGLVDHCTYEQRFTHRDGQVVHCLVSSALVRGADGHPKSFITQLQDITQRRLAEKALHAAFKKSDTHAVRMGALNETVEALMRCESSDEALHLIDLRLKTMFFPFDCEFVRPDPAGHLPDARSETLDFPVELNGKVMGLLRIHASEAARREEDEDMDTFAETVGDSVSLAMSNLQLREEMRLQVARDVLTGLYNRRYLDEIMAHEMDRCARMRQPLSVALLDLDHFSAINEQYGFDAGDAFLQRVASLLDQWTRASDKACRFGGAAFALVMPGAGAEDVVARLDDLRRKVAQLCVQWADAELPSVAVSIGVAQALSRGDKPEMLLKRADAALREAKLQGRDRIHVSAA